MLHAPYSMRRVSNRCYMHHIQRKVFPTCATHTKFNTKAIHLMLHTPYSMQRPSNRCYMHHIQCKVFPICATHQCKVYTGQMIGCPLFCQFNSLSQGDDPSIQPLQDLLISEDKISLNDRGHYSTTQVKLTLQETLNGRAL